MIEMLAAIGYGTAAIAIVAIIILVRRNASHTAGERAALAAGQLDKQARLDSERVTAQAEKERDEALERAGKAEAELAEARTSIAALEGERNAAVAKGITCAVEVIQNAPDGRVALDRLNELLAQMPGAGAPGDATADGHR